MNNRLKELRKDLGLTMEAFGNKIGIGKASISRIEAGSISLTDRNIDIICKEFRVNEEWLRTGEGDMFIELSEDEEIAEFIARLQRNPDYVYLKTLLRSLSRLGTAELMVMEKLAEDFANSPRDPKED